MVDCSLLITKATVVLGQTLSIGNIPSELLAGCAQAEATRRAAKIAALATTNAALIQLGAATFVIVSAVVAYLGAARQAHLGELQAYSRRLTFAKRVAVLANELGKWAKLQTSIAEKQYKDLTLYANHKQDILIIPPPRFAELDSARWSDHALLGEGLQHLDTVGSILRLETSLKTFNDFVMEVQKRRLTVSGRRSNFAMLLGEFNDGFSELRPDPDCRETPERFNWESPIQTCHTLAADIEYASEYLLTDVNDLISNPVLKSRLGRFFSK